MVENFCHMLAVVVRERDETLKPFSLVFVSFYYSAGVDKMMLLTTYFSDSGGCMLDFRHKRQQLVSTTLL